MIKHIKIAFGIIGRYLIYLLLPSVLYFIALVIIKLFGVDDFTSYTGALIVDILVLIVVFFAFKFYSKEAQKVVFEGKISIRKVLKLIPLSVLIRLPILIIGIVLYLFLGEKFSTTIEEGINFQWSVFDDSTLTSTFIGFMSFVVIGPIQEELFFRGVVQRYLLKHYSIRTGLIYSSVVFALVHIHPFLILNAFFFGALLGYIYHKWKNLWYSIILHMMINLLPFIFQLASK